MGLLDTVNDDNKGGDLDDLLGGEGGARFFKWGEEVGAGLEGVIVTAEKRQARKFDVSTGRSGNELAFYDDGNPIMELVLTLQTKLRDDADDDGLRRVSLTYRHQKQLRELLNSQGHRFGVGATFAMKWTSGRGTSSSPRQFAMAYKPAAGADEPDPF